MIDVIKNSFKGFDVNNLDLATAGSWPIGAKVICYVLVFSIVLVLGAHYYISDKEQILSTEISRELQLKKQYAAESNKVANLAGLRKQMADVEEQFKEIRRQLPTEKEVPGLLEDITNIGIESGLIINSIALQAERKERYYIELPIQISAQGTYHQVGSFVSGIAAIKRIVTLHNYSLTPIAEGRLSISITAKTYRNEDE
ncbi:pilus assembly protein PilP ['Osedax' symbiont bacterium Rs2_46_30_T18]|nr:pilus assembly protein PilP ['Osedax' symbiont bacterium Rs2_46_30_T18]